MTFLPNVEVTKATHGDLAQVQALIRRCALLETGVAEAIDDFRIARSEGRLVGCAGLETYGELGLLRSVAVESTARNAGVGTRLVDASRVAARASQLRELFLLTTTATAAHFFERRGFVSVHRSALPAPIAQSWEFRVGCPQTALAMRCALGGEA